jgi:hypothetical protein
MNTAEDNLTCLMLALLWAVVLTLLAGVLFWKL